MNTLTKKEIINYISNSYGISYKLCEDYVSLLTKQIIKTLLEGKRVKIKNFGIFESYNKEKRIGRNPKTLEHYEIKARNNVKFISAKKLRANINHE